MVALETTGTTVAQKKSVKGINAMVAYNGVVCTPLLTPLVHFVSDLVCVTFFKNNSFRYTCPSFQEELDFSPSVWVQQMEKDLQP